jgi:WD40 repeat protein
VRVWKRVSLFESPEEGHVGPDGEPYKVHGESESIVFHHSGAVTGLSLAGRELVTCSLDSTIRVWDTLTDRCVACCIIIHIGIYQNPFGLVI